MVEKGDADEGLCERADGGKGREVEEVGGIVDEGGDGAHGVDGVGAEEGAEGDVGKVVDGESVVFVIVGVRVDGGEAGETEGEEGAAGHEADSA